MCLEYLQDLHEKLIEVPIRDECFFSVVIPVCNEAANLTKTLDGLTRQINLNDCSLDYKWFEIIFFVNNSDDDSANIIRRWQTKNNFLAVHLAEEKLPSEKSNIGYVRRRLMNEAFLRLRGNGFGGGIIATTDGDTVIAPRWIAANIAEIFAGADAVGGRILIDPSGLQAMDAKCRAFHLRDTGYRLMTAEIETYLDGLGYDPLPRHHQHFNGSFAVTTGAFEKAGGVPEVICLEDVAFYQALLKIDAKFRHSPRVRVQTSARSEGRTALGLSTQINEWTIMGCNNDQYFVESAPAIFNRFQNRKNLRFLWNRQRENVQFTFDEIKLLADDVKISFEFLKTQVFEKQTFGCFYQNILNEQNRIGEWNFRNPLVEIERAMFDLRSILEERRKTL